MRQIFFTLACIIALGFIAPPFFLVRGASFSIESVSILDRTLYNRLKGRIILKVEGYGEAYYAHPQKMEMYYLGRPSDALSVMREMGVGISSANLEKISIGFLPGASKDFDSDGLSDAIEDAIGTNRDNPDTDGDGFDDKEELESNFDPRRVSVKLSIDISFSAKQKGKILLQVEKNGEAWYMHPGDSKRYFLGKPDDAFALLRRLGLGVSNKDFSLLSPSVSRLAEARSPVQQVLSSIPLVIEERGEQGVLTQSGVLLWTNLHRAQNGGLPPLAENELLNRVAQLKLRDLFEKQYFAHVSPTGIGPGDLAKQAGYEFILVGENLARGDFSDDTMLVQAWMDSPGHRANILQARFSEIGIAVEKGVYEGREMWIAVQSFGLPRSACPAVDESLRDEIKRLDVEIGKKNQELQGLKTELEGVAPQTQEEVDAYNKKIAHHNAFAAEINGLIDKQKSLIARANLEMSAFNACVVGE